MEKLNHLSDQELVAQYLAGDNEAFDCLLFRHKDKLFSYIYYRVRNMDLADDLFQETFTKALYSLHRGKYTETGQFQGWLIRLAHNLIVDTYRQEERTELIYQEEGGNEFLGALNINYFDPEEKKVDEQALLEAKCLMEQLPEDQKQVVFMRFYQDMPFKEIAEATGVSISTSLGRMRYALLNMRKWAKEQQLSIGGF